MTMIDGAAGVWKNLYDWFSHFDMIMQCFRTLDVLMKLLYKYCCLCSYVVECMRWTCSVLIDEFMFVCPGAVTKATIHQCSFNWRWSTVSVCCHIQCFYVRQHICYSAYMLSPVRLSVCLSVTRVDHIKTVEVRIMKLAPSGSPMILVFWRQNFITKF